MRRLILASASPRRRELLAQAGYTFEVQPAHVNEDLRADEDPIAYVVRLARDKAQLVFAEISSKSSAPPQGSCSAPILPSPSTAISSPSRKMLPMQRACCDCSLAALIA